ncbi:MAG: hypothetical protein ABIH70_03935 [Chloroflexota bacterium]
MSEVKGKVILLSAEGCGSNDDLGLEILANLLEALANREDRPVAIALWNTAVNLVVTGSPLLPSLRNLEQKGVKILAGKSCLVDLELEDKVAVGKIATMTEILDLLLHNDVVSL